MTIDEHARTAWRENRPGSQIQLLADPSARVTGLALVNQICAPGVGAPSHSHAFEEVVTVLEGTAEVWAGESRRVVGPGTSVFVPVGVVHGFRNVGDGPLRLQAVIAASELVASYQ